MTELATDSREYATVDVVAEALRLYAEGQGADRVGVRCLRPLYRADGSPILGERGEQRRAVLAGVYAVERIRDVAEIVAELDARTAGDPRDSLGIEGAVGRWHCYSHAQRVSAPITDAMLPGRVGTVAAVGIAVYTTLPGDLDLGPGAPAGSAVRMAERLAGVLTEIDRRIDPRAILLMQTGRGAYLNLAIDPQPLSARPVIRDALRTLARLVGAAKEPVHVDVSVHDPARILRIAGTTNHKPDADPCTPAWVLRPWTPGVRVPWAVIERLAAPSRPKLTVIAGRGQGPRGDRRPLLELFSARGWVYGVRSDGIADVRCPWADRHTDGREAAILYPPRETGGPGWVRCLHAHCADMTVADVRQALDAGGGHPQEHAS